MHLVSNLERLSEQVLARKIIPFRVSHFVGFMTYLVDIKEKRKPKTLSGRGAKRGSQGTPKRAPRKLRRFKPTAQYHV